MSNVWSLGHSKGPTNKILTVSICNIAMPILEIVLCFLFFVCVYKLNIQYTNYIQDIPTSLSADINQSLWFCCLWKTRRLFLRGK